MAGFGKPEPVQIGLAGGPGGPAADCPQPQQPPLVGARERADDVRHHQADESDRTDRGRDGGAERHPGDGRDDADAPDAHAEPYGDVVAERIAQGYLEARGAQGGAEGFAGGFMPTRT